MDGAIELSNGPVAAANWALTAAATDGTALGAAIVIAVIEAIPAAMLTSNVPRGADGDAAITAWPRGLDTRREATWLAV